jgi:hypothetical protein
LSQAPQQVEVLFARVQVFASVRELDRALQALGDALRAGFPLEDVERDPDLAELRASPRYKEMVAPYSRGAVKSRENPKQ